jgi:hypothetical protein
MAHRRRHPASRKKQTEAKQSLGLRFTVGMIAGFSVLAQGLTSMTTNRRWQWVWLLSAASAMVIVTLLAGTTDLGAVSQKVFQM